MVEKSGPTGEVELPQRTVAPRGPRPTLGLVGFGSFGRFAALHLKEFFEVRVTDRLDLSGHAKDLGVAWLPFAEVVGSDIVVLAIPVQDLGDVLAAAVSHVRPDALVIEVCSVKVKPTALVAAAVAAPVEVVGLHPMFGPQSGRDGIVGLKVALCNVRGGAAPRVKDFLEQSLGLQVREMTAEQHDREMAYIQGLTHWVAKALREIRLPDPELATSAYIHLLAIEELLRFDSDELFITIARENPYAEAARRELIDRLHDIADWVKGPANPNGDATGE